MNNFEEMKERNIIVPNGYIAIPVDTYIDLTMQSRVIEALNEFCLNRQIEDATSGCYYPTLKVRELSEISGGYITNLSEAEAKKMWEEKQNEFI